MRTLMMVVLSSLGAAATAQTTGTATLLQISVERAPGQSDKEFSARVDALKTAVAGVTSCDAGVAAAARAKAELLVRPNASLAALPAKLRDQLSARGQGRPTDLFGSRAAVRVLLSCPASFAAKLSGPPVKAPAGR